MLNSRKV